MSERTRKIVIAGALSAIAIFLGLPPLGLGYIPWITGTSLTIMHIPAIIGAVLEGPAVGGVIGLIFGVSSWIQAAVAPRGPGDTLFTDPVVSVLPRLLVGPIAWLVWRALERWPVPAMVAAGAVGSLAHTLLVLGAIGLRGHAPWGVMPPIILGNGLPEAVLSALLTLAVVAAWRRIEVGKRQGADL